MNLDHLNALTIRLLHEQARLDAATDPREIELRTVWVAGVKREITNEEARQGLDDLPDMNDEELLAELASD